MNDDSNKITILAVDDHPVLREGDSLDKKKSIDSEQPRSSAKHFVCALTE